MLFYVKGDNGGTIQRCDTTAYRSISDAPVFELAVSPDDDKLAFVTSGKRGPMVQWMSAHGGPVHVVTDSETACRPGRQSVALPADEVPGLAPHPLESCTKVDSLLSGKCRTARSEI